ncbi:hypothetical protein FA15DRAFT_475600 [Coprinopsis marcescibilis]|uniref:Uncharacterized protein n=1 Tax=Coprinopsis marcescibilis TaxID=230819 RepID=A0A5C3L4L1_COPMA|nr:hypothetical protein FA15DRAFT_475600 [Coprinopsis marcescibilis]
MECLSLVQQQQRRLNEPTSERDPSDTIAALQLCLNSLDSRGDFTRQALDELLRLRYESAIYHQFHVYGRFSLFRQARFLWGQYTLRDGSLKDEEAIEAQIIQTKYRLTRLQQQREQTATELTRLRSSVSACGRIPPEIWSITFGFCLPEDEPYVRPSVHNGPLLLCRVCRYWRDIAVSTPYLWNSISITKNWRRRKGQSLLELWLKRSANLPLSVEISISLYMEPIYDYATLDLIFSYSERWSRLRLNLTDHLLRSVLSMCMPMLEVLEFTSNYAIASLNMDHHAAPRLRSVSLLTVPLDPAPLSLPWHQLTHFSSRCWGDVQSHLDILKRCPNLEKFRMHLLHAQVPPAEEPLVMRNLKSLEVVAFIGSAMDSILNRLILPALSELILEVPDESPACGVSGWPKLVAFSLAERSACTMVKVRLKGIHVRPDESEYGVIKQRLVIVE